MSRGDIVAADRGITPLQSAALRAWDRALADYYYPPLPDVKVEHAESASSYFYIDTDDWTVHLNTAGIPNQLSATQHEAYLRSVCHHEIQHYLVCPYDTVMNGMMFASARKHVNDATAMFVCNLFADLVVDSKLLHRFPNLTKARVDSNIKGSAMIRSDHSELWLLIVSCYSAMWGFELPSSLRIDTLTTEVAETIVQITRKHVGQEAKWPKACEKIAKLISDWLPEEDDQLPGCAGGVAESGGGEEGDGSGSILSPLDVDATMGNPLEIRNGDMARRCMEGGEDQDLDAEMERLAAEVEQRGGDLKDLEGVYIVAGVGSKKKAWIRFWYRAKVRGLLRFDVHNKRPSGSTPLSADVWRLGDPVEELDIVQSLQAFPILIPNLSTRRWLRSSAFSDEEERTLPDLLMVIDSSGSMTWSMGKTRVSGAYHIALVSAFAALDTALRKGSRVAIINFSDGTRECDWTRERAPLERALLAYQGGGTVAPTQKIIEACDRAEKEVMVLMMTDAEIHNWAEMVESIRKLTKRGHKYFMFHIGDEYYTLGTKTLKSLQAAGATVLPVSAIEDLPGLVVREVRSAYGL